MVSRKFASILTTILVSLSTCVPVAADNTTMASVTGTVVDVKGGAVGHAKITAINDARGLQRETVTNDEGYFEILFLPTGVYTLTAEMPGFATIRVTQLEAQSGVNRRLMIVLQPRGRAETIIVKASSVTVEASDASLKYSITREQAETHPVFIGPNGRTVLNTLPLIVPGVSPSLAPGERGEGLSINGSRPLANVFFLNGGDNNDAETSIAASPFPNPDALQEVTITTNNHKADQGGGTGGIINVITKSGGNDLHGSLRYIFNHEALNARNFFAANKYYNRSKNYGGQIEGPFYIPKLYDGRERTHFFFDTEGYRFAGDYTTRIDVLPVKERSGDFSDYPADPNDSSFARQPIDPLTGQPFPGDIIPANRIDPLAKLYLDRFIPLPTFGDTQAERPTRQVYYFTQSTLRADHRINESDTLSATYFINKVANRYAVYDSPDGTRRETRADHNFVLSHTRIFSARTANQITATLIRSIYLDLVDRPGFTGIDPSQVGFIRIRPQTEKYLSLPVLNIASVRPGKTGDAFEQRYIHTSVGVLDQSRGEGYKTTFSIKNDLTQVRGSHHFGFGGGVRVFLFNRYVPNNNGEFSFQDSNLQGTGNGIADFLLGLPIAYQQTTGSIQYQRQKSYFAYAMDDWKARPNLTVNLGLRYELAPPTTDKMNQVVVFRPGQHSQRIPQAPEGALFAGDPDPVFGTVPRGGYGTDFNNLAPRIGIAFSPEGKRGWQRSIFGNGKTNVRAGFGVFYASTYGQHFSQFSNLEPFLTAVYFSDTPFFIGHTVGTFANPFGSNPNPFPADPENRPFGSFRNLHTFDPTFRTAYTYHYNLTIQRELPGIFMFELAYVGNNSFHTDRERELNSSIPDPSFPGALRNLYPELGSITSQESSGRARYDSVQLRVSRRLKGGLFFDGFYVYSKALDNSSGPFSTFHPSSNPLAYTSSYDRPNSTDPLSWARSSFDRRHSFVMSYVYDLGFGKRDGVVGKIANGWRIGGFTQLRSGLPMDINQAITKNANGRPDLVGQYKRPDPKQEQTIIVNGSPITGHFFFDPRAFRVVRDGSGTLGRNIFDGPGLNFTSISVEKRTKVFGVHEIEIRADIFNLFNQVNFAQPNQSAEFEDFGQVFSTLSARQIQLSLRYRF